MTTQLPKLIATSVVRGTQQGESHGGVYTVDFDQREVVQHVDWNTTTARSSSRASTTPRSPGRVSGGVFAVGERFVAAGSSPSTISLYDFEANQKVGSVNLTMDIRNAIHGLKIWPLG